MDKWINGLMDWWGAVSLPLLGERVGGRGTASFKKPLHHSCGRGCSATHSFIFSSIAPRIRAFTLIEVMAVVSIMAIVLAMSIPAVHRALSKEGLRRVEDEVKDACKNARADAIMHGSPVDVVFHPQDGHFEVAGAGGGPSQPGVGSEDGAPPPRNSPHSGRSGQIPREIMIDMLDINLVEFKETEVAHVRFYPNGTCDELTLILHSDQGEWRKITTEVTTGLVTAKDEIR